MPIKEYHDLTLVADDVQKDDAGSVTGFTVSVFDSPAGQGEKKEIVHIPPDLRRRQNWLEERRLDQDRERQIELGEVLAGLLLPNYAREFFAKSLAGLPEDEGLRLRLRLADELADFPWEYMYIQDARGERTAGGFLALDPRISIVRHEALAVPVSEERSGAPRQRRILVAMASPQPYSRYPRLGLPAEQQLLRATLDPARGLQVEYLPEYTGEPGDEELGATLKDLTGALMVHTDFFHFSGHGEFAQAMGLVPDTVLGEGAIVVADAQNRARLVPADRLAEMLRSKGVRLAVLGACQTGRRDGENVWSGVAASLLKARIPAVVAMQFTIEDGLATAFSGAFYQALVAGRTIDEAVAAGRAAIRVAALERDRPDVRDWGVPVLYLRTYGSGAVFRPVRDARARAEASEKVSRLITQQMQEVASASREVGAVPEGLLAETLIVDQDELSRTWSGWLANGELASRRALRRLAERCAEPAPTAELAGPRPLRRPAERSGQLAPGAIQTLFLLQSSVARGEDTGHWLSWLASDTERTGLIRQLEMPQAGENAEPVGRSTLRAAVALLGLGDVPLPAGAPAEGRPFGAVARSAVAHHDPIVRQTAALALAALGYDTALNRIGWALRASGLGRLQRRARAAELWGALCDALPAVEEESRKLPLLEQAAIWRWRAAERVRFGSRRLGTLTLGGAVGAGVAVGLLRAVIAAPARLPVGAFFAVYSYWGAILGAGQALGMLLAAPLLLAPDPPAEQDRPRLALAAAGQGVLLFALAHALVALLNGLPLAGLLVYLLAGILPGLGLSAALYGQPQLDHSPASRPRPQRLPAASRWLPRLAVAALAFALTQAALAAIPGGGPGIVVTWTAKTHGSYWGDYAYLAPWLALLDAALTGAALAGGLAAGMAVAARQLAKWRALVYRLGN